MANDSSHTDISMIWQETGIIIRWIRQWGHCQMIHKICGCRGEFVAKAQGSWWSSPTRSQKVWWATQMTNGAVLSPSLDNSLKDTHTHTWHPCVRYQESGLSKTWPWFTWFPLSHARSWLEPYRSWKDLCSSFKTISSWNDSCESLFFVSHKPSGSVTAL